MKTNILPIKNYIKSANQWAKSTNNSYCFLNFNPSKNTLKISYWGRVSKPVSASIYWQRLNVQDKFLYLKIYKTLEMWDVKEAQFSIFDSDSVPLTNSDIKLSSAYYGL